MEHFLRKNDDEVVKGNAYYWKWKIPELLPENVPMAEKKFKLQRHEHVWQSMTWTYVVWKKDGFLYIVLKHDSKFYNTLNYIYSSYEIRVGILGDDLKEIAAINIEVDHERELINSSQLHSVLMTNKFLYLFVEIVKKGVYGQTIKARNRRKRIEANFKELLFSGRNSDVTIEVKHKKFHCHRCILGARSAVFVAMFDHDMKEKTSGVLKIEDVEPDVFQEFLLYLYSGNDNLLSWKNFAELYKLANKYGVEDLKIVCTNDIKENINKENFIEFLKLSRLPNDSKLSQVVIQFFVDKSIEIVRREEWTTCLSENPVECNVLIKALADYSQKKREEISNEQEKIEALNAYYRDIE